ncbi:MAG: hypothetical protein KC425_25680 [Anaerolineales bacterium]|nr:hypothetical protein [Anaerolineales bacterium]
MARRICFTRLMLVWLGLLLAGCGTLASGRPEEGQTAVSSALPTKPALVSATPTLSPSATPSLTPSPPPSPTPTPVPPDLSLQAANVVLYPVPQIYSGDRVTFQVLPFVPDNLAPENVVVHILVDDQVIATGALTGRNLAGQALGVLEWAWDTGGISGAHTVTVVLDPEDVLQIGDENPTNNTVTFPIIVQARDALPAPEQNATWVTAESACCLIHAVSGTAAYRDLPELLLTAEAAVQRASDMLLVSPRQKLEIYFIDRVIGQGGYAATAMVISYLDRQYASQGLLEVLTHETVHVLDRQFAPQRIPFMAEGLAVWATGGHYKPEDLDQRMAALLELGEYVPLARLIDDFYPVQHEIGYLEAAGFVNLLVGRAGWEQFKLFYTDVTADDAPTLSESIDLNLQLYYGLTLAQLEAEWLAQLQARPADKAAVLDLQTTLRYFNVMRDYQLAYDPTAYFLTAWLPYPDDVLAQGNPADLTRHPQAELNITVETMFQSADTALRAADYNRANVLLDSIVRVLEYDGAFRDPLAISYRDIVRTVLNRGYEPQQVTIQGETAVVQATPFQSTRLVKLNLALRGQDWALLSN